MSYDNGCCHGDQKQLITMSYDNGCHVDQNG